MRRRCRSRSLRQRLPQSPRPLPSQRCPRRCSRQHERHHLNMNQEKDMIESITERDLAEKSVAPRVTPDDIEGEIVDEKYFTAEQGAFGARVDPLIRAGNAVTLADVPATEGKALELLTFCVLVLRNGFTVTGESACASPENFDAEIGRRIARKNAIDRMWPLLGSRLKDRLHALDMPTAPKAA